MGAISPISSSKSFYINPQGKNEQRRLTKHHKENVFQFFIDYAERETK